MKVHLLDGTPAPDDDSYFIIAGNGVFLRKRTGWVEATVPVKHIDGLATQEVGAKLLLPRLKSTTFAKAVLFFHEVYRLQKTEAAVLLHHSDKHGWEITVPAQTATSAHVTYEMADRLPGYRCVGTMHSHGDMLAFHSSTDIGDEASQDGIHITIGSLDRFPRFGMDAEFVVNGTRFPLPHEHLIRVQKATLPFMRPAEQPAQPEGSDSADPAFACTYQLYRVPFGILRDWKVPDEWIARVKKVEPPRVEPQGLGHFFGDWPSVSPHFDQQRWRY